jgi:hypothetical protein
MQGVEGKGVGKTGGLGNERGVGKVEENRGIWEMQGVEGEVVKGDRGSGEMYS